MQPFHTGQSGPARPRVQPESRFRVSRETDKATEALVHASHLAASQKRALHATIHEATQAARAIAENAGIGYQFLCATANPSLRDQLPFMRLPLVLESSDNLTYVRFLADLQHAAVVPLPHRGADADVRQASATMREFAEFLEAGAAASDDDVVTPEEFARVEREGQEAVEAILGMVAHYRARVRRPLLQEGR
jgi:hypothetical protein